MDPYDEEAAAKYMMDAINEDIRVNAAEQFSAEEARTTDSFLNMSGDGSDGDDDFTPMPPQQPVAVRILIMHGESTILDFCYPIFLQWYQSQCCLVIDSDMCIWRYA